MKALNLTGQEIIKNSRETRFNNKLKVLSCHIYSIQKDIELTINIIEEPLFFSPRITALFIYLC